MACPSFFPHWVEDDSSLVERERDERWLGNCWGGEWEWEWGVGLVGSYTHTVCVV